jgi:hypothetical protein
MLGKFQKSIDELPELETYRYENIFKIYETEELGISEDKNFYMYNIVKKIHLPDDLDNSFFEYFTLNKNIPLTTISYKIYSTTYLWWLIMLVNKIINPYKDLPVGKKIRYIKPEFVKIVIDAITKQLQ